MTFFRFSFPYFTFKNRKITCILNVRRYYVPHFWGKITNWIQAKTTTVDKTPSKICLWPYKLYVNVLVCKISFIMVFERFSLTLNTSMASNCLLFASIFAKWRHIFIKIHIHHLFANLVIFTYYFPKLFHLQFEPKHFHVYDQISTSGVYLDLISYYYLETIQLLESYHVPVFLSTEKKFDITCKITNLSRLSKIEII